MACQCPSCEEWFRSVAGFDQHRVGTFEPLARRCLTPEEMEAAGMIKNAQGRWVTHKWTEDAGSRVRECSQSDDLSEPIP